MAFLQKLFQAAFLLAFGLAFLLLCAESGFLPAVFMAIAALVFAWAVSRLKTRRFALWLFLFAFVSRFLLVLTVQTPVTSDFELMLAAARQLARDDLTFTGYAYYRLWPYQIPFTAWQALLLRVNDSILFLKTVNCLFSAGIHVLVYLTAKEVSEEQSARFAALLYFCFLSPASLVPVLTNQHASAFFLLLGLWIFMAGRLDGLKLRQYALSGVCLAAGNLMRPEGILIFAAVFAYVLFCLVRRFDWKEARQWLFRLSALLLCYAAVGFGAARWAKSAELTETGLANQNPLWKFVLGLNHETGGGYSDEDARNMSGLYLAHGAGEELFSYERDLIRERLRVPPDVLARLFVRKIRCMWTQSDMSWGFGHFRGGAGLPGLFFDVSGEELYGLLARFDQGVRAVLLFLALWSVFRMGRGEKEDLRRYLAPFTLFAAFCAFLFVEVQGRYAYMPQIFLAVAAALGADAARALMKNRKEGKTRCL